MNRAAVLAVSAGLALAGCATTPAAPVGAPKPAAPQITSAQQWLFGSAESAVAIRQTYDALVAYVRGVGVPANSVVLAEGASPADPRFVSCTGKPRAVVFDADETLIWNMGSARWMAERGIAFDAKVWDQWEKTGAGKAPAMPGAVDALNALRAAGVTVIANTNREAANAQGTVDALAAAGLGSFEHGKTLFLRGDDAGGSSKDGRRATISARYCVVAMVGDQLGDFAQAFNEKALTPAARNTLATSGPIAALWGKGWFMLPNPTYGPWDRMSFDETYPAQTRWEPEGNQ